MVERGESPVAQRHEDTGPAGGPHKITSYEKSSKFLRKGGSQRSLIIKTRASHVREKRASRTIDLILWIVELVGGKGRRRRSFNPDAQ